MGESTTFLSTLISLITQLITGLTGWMTSFTTWIKGDEVALLFIGIMLMMLAVHLIKSFIRQV